MTRWCSRYQPTNGVLKEIRIQGGATVAGGQVLAVIEEGAAAAKAAPVPVKVQAAAVDTATGDSAKLSPSVRRLVEENKLDPAADPCIGQGRPDHQGGCCQFPRWEGSHPTPAAPATAPGTAVADPASRAGRVDQRVPMTRLRQRIAERLVQAQATQALLTTLTKMNLSAVIALRARYKDRFEKEHGVKLGFMGLFVKAAIEALKKFPS